MADDRLQPVLDEEDEIQHGLDDEPSGDAEKGAALGGLGGAAVGAAAGMVVGPAGALAGAVIGGLAGAVASGLAVAAVDRIDHDNTVSGMGTGATAEIDENLEDPDLVPGNRVPGVQTGGYANDGTPDSRGMMEKTADVMTGDVYDDKTGKRIDDPDLLDDEDEDLVPGNRAPGIQTGGRNRDGSPDSRGISEKVADAVTGDRTDDKTGKRV